MDKFVKECFVKNVHHFQALDVWEKLHVGMELKLKYNEKHPKEVLVTLDECVIGNLSEDDSKLIIDILEYEYKGIFIAKVAYLDEKNEENKRIKVVIYIKRNK